MSLSAFFYDGENRNSGEQRLWMAVLNSIVQDATYECHPNQKRCTRGKLSLIKDLAAEDGTGYICDLLDVSHKGFYRRVVAICDRPCNIHKNGNEISGGDDRSNGDTRARPFARGPGRFAKRKIKDLFNPSEPNNQSEDSALLAAIKASY
jgi:hypothetical protein